MKWKEWLIQQKLTVFRLVSMTHFKEYWHYSCFHIATYTLHILWLLLLGVPHNWTHSYYDLFYPLAMWYIILHWLTVIVEYGYDCSVRTLNVNFIWQWNWTYYQNEVLIAFYCIIIHYGNIKMCIGFPSRDHNTVWSRSIINTSCKIIYIAAINMLICNS